MKFNQSKRWLSWVMALSLAMLLLIPFSSAVAAANTVVSIGAPATVAAGDSCVVNVNIASVTNLNAFQFDLSYNNSVIQVAGTEGENGVTGGLVASTALPLNMWGFYPSGIPGTIRVFGNLVGASEVSGQGYLIQVHFNVVGTAGQASDLTVSGLELVSGTGVPIPAVTSPGRITVAQSPDDPLVSLTPAAQNVSHGGSFTVTINVGSVSNFNAYQFDLEYNNAVIQVAGNEGGPAVTGGSIDNQTVPLAMWGFYPVGAPGCIRVLGHLPGVTIADGQGYLARVQFDVAGTVGQSSNLTLSNVSLYNNVGAVMPSSHTGGSVTVTSMPLEIVTAALSDAVLGSNYNAALGAQGGQGPYAWNGGGLPSGLTLSSSGVLSGHPTVSGSFDIAFSVTDSASPAASALKTLRLQVYPALQISTAALAEGSTALNYSLSLAAAGGKGPYTWSASGLPSGLVLSTAGVISGKPLSAAVYNVTIMVTDSFSPANSTSLTLPLKIWLAGDADGDGQINMADVTKVERIVLGLDPYTPGGDANGDGSVNMGDVTRIEIKILGL